MLEKSHPSLKNNLFRVQVFPPNRLYSAEVTFRAQTISSLALLTRPCFRVEFVSIIVHRMDVAEFTLG